MAKNRKWKPRPRFAGNTQQNNLPPPQNQQDQTGQQAQQVPQSQQKNWSGITAHISTSQKPNGDWLVVTTAYKGGRPQEGISFVFVQNGINSPEVTDSKGVCAFEAKPGKIDIHTPEEVKSYNLDKPLPPKKPPVKYPSAPVSMPFYQKPFFWFETRFFTKNDFRNNFRAYTFCVVWIAWLFFNSCAVGLGPIAPVISKEKIASIPTKKEENAEKRKNFAEYGKWETDEKLGLPNAKKHKEVKSSALKGIAGKASFWSWVLCIIALPIVLINLAVSFKEEFASAIKKATEKEPSSNPQESSEKDFLGKLFGITGSAIRIFLDEILISPFRRRWF